MLKNILTSEKGFGIVQILGALIIATIAIAGLFVTAYYTRHKAVGNYHYRVALLKATQKLEEIKYYNHNNQNETKINNISSGLFLMDKRDGVPLYARIHPPRKETHRDMVVSEFVLYDQITIKITWKDGPERFHMSLLTREKQLVLREDYFYRTDVVPE